MSEQIIRYCDMCGRETEDLSNIVINIYERRKYQNQAREYYCAKFDICHDCSKKYKLPDYGFEKEKIEFIKENSSFLSKLWKKITGDE